MLKTKNVIKLLFTASILFILFPLFSFHTDDILGKKSAGGQVSSCGSTGEAGTCSQTACHGKGGGGLADNAGPGSVVFTSVPAIASNKYVPGQLYHITIKVSEMGKARFGFGCEILDNSGSTNGHVDNTAGTITITDAVNTRIWKAFGIGRSEVTQNTPGGFGSNTASFNFDWTAPATGTVNCFLAGNATNNNTLADGADNVYTQHIIWNPQSAGITESESTKFMASIFPSPSKDMLTIQMNILESGDMKIQLYNLNGTLVKTLSNRKVENGMFNEKYLINDLPKGIYLLTINCNQNEYTKKIIIE